MNTVTLETRSQVRFGPYFVVVPILMVILAFYARQFLPAGVLSIAAGALIGALWALGLGFVAQRLARREAWRARLANGVVFLSIIVIGLSIGGSLMYQPMMNAALGEITLQSI